MWDYEWDCVENAFMLLLWKLLWATASELIKHVRSWLKIVYVLVRTFEVRLINVSWLIVSIAYVKKRLVVVIKKPNGLPYFDFMFKKVVWILNVHDKYASITWQVK